MEKFDRESELNKMRLNIGRLALVRIAAGWFQTARIQTVEQYVGDGLFHGLAIDPETKTTFFCYWTADDLAPGWQPADGEIDVCAQTMAATDFETMDPREPKNVANPAA